MSKGLAIAGAVGILLMSGRDNKNPVLRIALGAYDLYNITGWLSDVLSYSRLLALGLATGVIASVVNQMGSMLGNEHCGSNPVYRGICDRTRNEHGDQPVGRVRAYKPSSVCRVLWKIL